MAPYALSLRITASDESIQVLGARGRIVTYPCFEENQLRREIMPRGTKAEAIEIAQQIARALKNASAVLLVPIHDELIRMGLLACVDRQRINLDGWLGCSRILPPERATRMARRAFRSDEARRCLALALW